MSLAVSLSASRMLSLNSCDRRVIVAAIKGFAKSADDKSRKSAERVIKVWEERRVFSPNHTKQMRELIKAAPAAAAAAGGKAAAPASKAAAAAAPAPPSAMASSDLKKLQVLMSCMRPCGHAEALSRSACSSAQRPLPHLCRLLASCRTCF